MALLLAAVVTLVAYANAGFLQMMQGGGMNMMVPVGNGGCKQVSGATGRMS